MTKLPMADCRLPNVSCGRRRRSSSGFTLVEVLASLAVVLIALPVAMEAISLASSVATRTRRQLEAANLAASKLAELVATNGWQNGNSTGDFSPDFPDYTWTSQVSPYQQAATGGATAVGAGTSGATLGSATTTQGTTMGGTTALGVTLQELDVTVSWPGRNTTFSITLSTLIYPGTGSS